MKNFEQLKKQRWMLLRKLRTLYHKAMDRPLTAVERMEEENLTREIDQTAEQMKRAIREAEESWGRPSGEPSGTVTEDSEKEKKGEDIWGLIFKRQPEKWKGLKSVATSPLGSDCTQAFRLDGCEGMKVAEVIGYILHGSSKSRGEIDVRTADGVNLLRKPGAFLMPTIRYGDDGLVLDNMTLGDEMLRIVDHVNYAGGWGRFDFIIFVK